MTAIGSPTMPSRLPGKGMAPPRVPTSPPCFPDAATRARVGTVFSGAQFGEPAIAALCGVATLADARSVAALVLARSPAGRSSLGVLVRLFLLDQAVDAADATRALGLDAIEALQASAILHGDQRSLLASVRLTPVGHLLIASDRTDRHTGDFPDFVVGPAPVSRLLAELLICRPAARTLDLGCGSGILGLQATRWSEEVVVADINPRAIAFAAFNAELNTELNRLQPPAKFRAVCSDLFAALEGERFSRIICNPPFVISPHADFVYRDGGTAICHRIIEQAAHHLEPGGTLQMLCNWPEPARGDWRTVPAQWFADSRCDVWLLRLKNLPAARYAAVWLSQTVHGAEIPAAAFDHWMAHLEQMGADSVATGLVVMRPAIGRPPWIEFREAPNCLGQAGESIARVLDARDYLAGLGSDGQLLDAALLPCPTLQIRSTQRRRAASGEQNGRNDLGEWAETRIELRTSDGFPFVTRVDPVLSELLAGLDGRQSLRQLVADFAAERGLVAEDFLPQLPAAVRRLVALGMLKVPTPASA